MIFEKLFHKQFTIINLLWLLFFEKNNTLNYEHKYSLPFTVPKFAYRNHISFHCHLSLNRSLVHLSLLQQWYYRYIRINPHTLSQHDMIPNSLFTSNYHYLFIHSSIIGLRWIRPISNQFFQMSTLLPLLCVIKFCICLSRWGHVLLKSLFTFYTAQVIGLHTLNQFISKLNTFIPENIYM